MKYIWSARCEVCVWSANKYSGVIEWDFGTETQFVAVVRARAYDYVCEYFGEGGVDLYLHISAHTHACDARSQVVRDRFLAA